MFQVHVLNMKKIINYTLFLYSHLRINLCFNLNDSIFNFPKKVIISKFF